MFLTFGFEFQCVNGARLVLSPFTSTHSHALYYPDKRHIETFDDDISLYADRLSGQDKKKKMHALYARLTETDEQLVFSTPHNEVYTVTPDDLEGVLNNEMEAVMTYRTPRAVASSHIVDALVDMMVTASTSLTRFFEHESVVITPLRGHHTRLRDLNIGAMCILAPASTMDPGVIMLLPKAIDRQYIKTDLRWNCQMTIGIPLTHICEVLMALCRVYLHVQQQHPQRFHPDETSLVVMTRDLITSLRRDSQVTEAFRDIVCVVVYVVRTRMMRKASPFIVRHLLKKVLSRVTSDDRGLLVTILAMADRYTDGQASSYVLNLPPAQQYRVSEQYQHLQQTTTYPLTQHMSTLTLLVEFRYLANVLGSLYRSPADNSQTLTELSRLHRVKSRLVS